MFSAHTEKGGKYLQRKPVTLNEEKVKQSVKSRRKNFTKRAEITCVAMAVILIMRWLAFHHKTI